MRSKGCVYVCVYVCVYRWKSTKLGGCATRASCHVDGPAVLKSLVSKFFFFFGLDSKGSSVSIHSGL